MIVTVDANLYRTLTDNCNALIYSTPIGTRDCITVLERMRVQGLLFLFRYICDSCDRLGKPHVFSIHNFSVSPVEL